jgi:hypothetical protein
MQSPVVFVAVCCAAAGIVGLAVAALGWLLDIADARRMGMLVAVAASFVFIVWALVTGLVLTGGAS